MTDDNRPMDPERLALMKELIARTEGRHWAYDATEVDPVAVAEMLGEYGDELIIAHDHHRDRAHDLANRVMVLEAQLADTRKLLACERESSAIVANGFEQAVRELERLRSDLDLYDRTRLSDLRAQAEVTCERRTAERDEAKTERDEARREIIRDTEWERTCYTDERDAAQDRGWGYLYPEGPDATEGPS